ncbi:hypothetical protein CT0861_09393 [Colletotrichum tofieldiae]|uniref:Uncharacterized protein n=1 Tax=Colletotrichum tofieldiae TaxID=708197 RepID=A0A166TVV8_9PEZI|nr:hypothetical protein CT0861_09393 [Colletotrichum tofieldiae]
MAWPATLRHTIAHKSGRQCLEDPTKSHKVAQSCQKCTKNTPVKLLPTARQDFSAALTKSWTLTDVFMAIGGTNISSRSGIRGLPTTGDGWEGGPLSISDADTTWARSPSATEQRNAPNDPGVGLLRSFSGRVTQQRAMGVPDHTNKKFWLVALERGSGRRVSHEMLPITFEDVCSESWDRTSTIRHGLIAGCRRTLQNQTNRTDMHSSHAHQPWRASSTRGEIETSQQPYSIVACVFPGSLAAAAAATDGHGGQRTASAQFD